VAICSLFVFFSSSLASMEPVLQSYRLSPTNIVSEVAVRGLQPHVCMALVFTSRPILSSATEAIVCNTTSSKSNTDNNINYYFSESRNDSKSCTALRMNCSYHTRRSACRLSNASGSSSNFCMVGIASFQDSTITIGESNQ